MTTHNTRSLISLEKKLSPSPVMNILVPVISVFLALLTGAIFLALTGKDPIQVYSAMFYGAFGSKYGLTESVVKAIPLLLAGLGLAVAFRMQLWNIGGEGQIYMGAFGATWVALQLPNQPTWVVLPAMMLAGAAAGGLWAVIPAIPRAYLGVNEIITTLMLNYVAILWVDYLVYGPWKDPAGYNFPITPSFSESAILPTLGDTRIHAGLLIGIILAIIIYLIIFRTKFGYEIRVIGESPGAARYAGMNISRKIIVVMLISGAVCGLAGMAELSGVTHRLQQGFSPGYGYTAIIVAWLTRLNPLGIIIAALLFGGMQVGGFAVQMNGVPAAVVSMLQGGLLFFVLGGEILTRYRVSINSRRGDDKA
ncbi:MAG: ABC transporter permease [Firmicutes bacterium]|nr:ABC transporter permease [Bacillota bacterium]